jgi:hypothetical protein
MPSLRTLWLKSFHFLIATVYRGWDETCLLELVLCQRAVAESYASQSRQVIQGRCARGVGLALGVLMVRTGRTDSIWKPEDK